MKPGIHPEYKPVIFLDTSANHSILTRSAIDTKGRETMKWTDGKAPRGMFLTSSAVRAMRSGQPRSPEAARE